ncbi:hypothetical protein BDZ90DRAFT_191433 [Jaminaea rosea]|uniref:Nitrogen regulatory protein areA GATA-like domain-containing protein n=1 Tax=Jaminaea rosea TaxID=1569628 RepID=A0A316USB1_9BASI|nr:hypothetical protein BDZ90DRAFT_191433 [Jaminaea rosea]PWN26763.1 hypothetical protein BDZ90DRAFT_191433 [Jaminaea rosea]
MLSAPQPYPSVSAATPAPDDAQIEKKMPSICVDYLSHNWAQEDVWQSWKAMTKRKNEIANGVRLENASWRTWAKQRGNLKTINPETLNWLKDSDVTWLYGPLHEHADPVPPPKVASTQDRLDLDDSSAKKSILKHRTIGEMLTTPGRAASPAVEVHMDPEFAPSRDASPQGRPPIGTTVSIASVKSDTNLAGKILKGAKGSPPASARLLNHPSLERSDTTTTAGSEEKRHISFNSRVDQCIAVDYPEEEYGYSDGEYDDDEEDEGTHSDENTSSGEEGDVLTMKSSPRSASQASLSSRQSSPSSEHQAIIAKLAPTRLKTSDTYPAPSPAVVDPSGFTTMPHQQQNGSAAPATSIVGGGSALKVSSQPHVAEERSMWDDDQPGSVDYFNAPYLSDRGTGGGNESGSIVTSQAGAGGRERSSSISSEGDIDIRQQSSSDSGSAVGSSGSSSGGVPAQPRSILKRRNSQQPQDSVPKDEVASKPPGSSSAFLASNTDGGNDGGVVSAAGAGSAAAAGAAAIAASGAGSSSYGGGSSSALATSYDSSDSQDDAAEEKGRGRTSQRLGSSASYERIQEAARKSSTGGSTSRGSSVASSSTSPSGSQQRTYHNASDNLGSGGGSFGARRASMSSDDDASSVGSSSHASTKRKGSSSSLRGSGANKDQQSGSSKGLPPAGSQRLSVDLDNLPSNDPASHKSGTQSSKSGMGSTPTPGAGGPTPLNTPTLALAHSRRHGSYSGQDDDEDEDEDEYSYYTTRDSRRTASNVSGAPPLSPVIPRRTSATGALVAPSGADRQAGVRVPLADDFVEEDEGGIVGRAVEIVNTARDLIAAVWPTRGR